MQIAHIGICYIVPREPGAGARLASRKYRGARSRPRRTSANLGVTVPYHLPDEFVSSHEFCFFLHDQMVNLLIEGEKAQVFDNTINFETETEASEFGALSGEDLLDWLRSSGREADSNLFLKKQVTAALLSDFLHFVYEGLKCSEKKKLTVALALFRKPFRENLFYLEWLLADEAGFLARFEGGGRNRFEFPERKRREPMIETIRAAAEKTHYGSWHDPQSMYELRYDKSRFGLDAYWNMAAHLHTDHPGIETEPGNFNFVFSTDDDIHAQWKAIYSVIPVLLFHSLQLVQTIIHSFAIPADDSWILDQMRTDIGLSFWLIDHASADEWEGLRAALVEHYEEINLVCSGCGAGIALDEPNLRSLYGRLEARCRACGQVLSLGADT